MQNSFPAPDSKPQGRRWLGGGGGGGRHSKFCYKYVPVPLSRSFNIVFKSQINFPKSLLIFVIFLSKIHKSILPVVEPREWSRYYYRTVPVAHTAVTLSQLPPLWCLSPPLSWQHQLLQSSVSPGGWWYCHRQGYDLWPHLELEARISQVVSDVAGTHL